MPKLIDCVAAYAAKAQPFLSWQNFNWRNVSWLQSNRLPIQLPLVARDMSLAQVQLMVFWHFWCFNKNRTSNSYYVSPQCSFLFRKGREKNPTPVFQSIHIELLQNKRISVSCTRTRPIVSTYEYWLVFNSWINILSGDLKKKRTYTGLSTNIKYTNGQRVSSILLQFFLYFRCSSPSVFSFSYSFAPLAYANIAATTCHILPHQDPLWKLNGCLACAITIIKCTYKSSMAVFGEIQKHIKIPHLRHISWTQIRISHERLGSLDKSAVGARAWSCW